MPRYLHLSLLLALLSTAAYAQNTLLDVVYLKNGSIIKGTVVEQVMGESIKIETRDGNLFVFKAEEVEKITREQAPSTGSTVPQAVTPSGAMPEIGMQYGGGVVFHVDATSRTVWVAAPNDQAYRQMWGADGTTRALSYEDGRHNTDGIISFYRTTRIGPSHTGASVCDRLTLGQRDDWYLPALNELERLYHQHTSVGGFRDGIYQSSTEQGRQDFYGVDFRPGRRLVNNFHKDNNDFNIRCIRRQTH